MPYSLLTSSYGSARQMLCALVKISQTSSHRFTLASLSLPSLGPVQNQIALNTTTSTGETVYTMSNIVNVFNPPPSRDLTPEETKDCVPCQIMSTCFALGAGYWFASGRVFENDKITVEENLKKNPIWWRNAVKGFGVGLLGFGVVRGTEGILWGTKSEVLE